MGFWSEWQAARARRQRVELYLNHVLRDADPSTVGWLREQVGAADAHRELMFARRALGLIVAERDALDDQTAADVAHLLSPVVAAEARQNPETGRQWSERSRAYVAALATRGSAEPPAMRLARVLLEGAGQVTPQTALLDEATRFIQETRAALNENLRTALGAASLPEDVRPSAMRG